MLRVLAARTASLGPQPHSNRLVTARISPPTALILAFSAAFATAPETAVKTASSLSMGLGALPPPPLATFGRPQHLSQGIRAQFLRGGGGGRGARKGDPVMEPDIVL